MSGLFRFKASKHSPLVQTLAQSAVIEAYWHDDLTTHGTVEHPMIILKVVLMMQSHYSQMALTVRFPGAKIAPTNSTMLIPHRLGKQRDKR